MKNLIIAIAISAASTACVKKSTHRGMKQSLQQQIESRDAEVDRLSTRATAQDGQLASKQGEILRLTQQLSLIIKDKAALVASAEELQAALLALSRRKAEAERRIAQYKGLLAKFKNLIDTGKLRIRIVDGRMVLALPSDVLFASGRADLSEEGREAVAEVAAVLSTISDRRVQVEGHTDTVPIKTRRFPSNWELASARALVVVSAMVGSGMNAAMISAATYGEERPAQDNETAEGRARNRRIEIVLQPDLSMLPGFDELNRLVKAQ